MAKPKSNSYLENFQRGEFYPEQHKRRLNGHFVTVYADWMPQVIIELMGNGASMVEVSASLGISKATFQSWRGVGKESRPIPEVIRAVEIGYTLSQAWWESQGKKGMWGGKQFNGPTYQFMMRGRFREDWNLDKQQIDVNLNASNPLLDAIKNDAAKDWVEEEND